MKTRSKKELTQLVLDHMTLFQSGLCRLIDRLFCEKLINTKEWKLIREYFSNHRPCPKIPEDGYWWSKDDPIPRIAFLNKRLQRLNKKWYKIL